MSAAIDHPETPRISAKQLNDDVLRMIGMPGPGWWAIFLLDLLVLGVTLVVDGPEQAIPVMGDVVQLQQLACNLLMNGAEAMESKRPGERLLTLTWRGGDVEHAVIEIQDRGIGVDPSFLDQLEQPFYTTKPHGMGMGLAICKSILDAHGGTMDFSSRPEGGTVVRLRLPRSPATLPWPVQR